MGAHFFRRLAFRKTVNQKEGSDLLERCNLIDISEKGARLTISDVHDLPDNFKLYLARESLLGQQCRVIWRRDHEIGVEFLIEEAAHR